MCSYDSLCFPDCVDGDTVVVAPQRKGVIVHASWGIIMGWLIQPEGIKLIKMPPPIYCATNPQRVNPQFYGIAEKHYLHKKTRLDSQKRRNSLRTNLQFKLSIDHSLEKSLQAKRQELRRVKMNHQRHCEDLRSKMEEQQRRTKMIADLRDRSSKTRDEARKNLDEAQRRMREKNQQDQQELSQFFMTTRSEFQTRKKEELQSNKIRFREVKLHEKVRDKTVDEFYKGRNKESLQVYQQMIQEEKAKHCKFTEEISQLQQSLQTVEEKISHKKRDLCDVVDEIGQYTLVPPEQRAKCLPYFLRDDLSLSHHSSRPRDLLLKGVQAVMKEKANQLTSKDTNKKQDHFAVTSREPTNGPTNEPTNESNAQAKTQANAQAKTQVKVEKSDTLIIAA